MFEASKNAFFFSVMLCLSAFAAYSQELGVDTLKTVQVNGLSLQKYASGSTETLIDSLALAFSASGSVADLAQNASGVYIKSYGNNMLSSISFRGGSAGQTAVLWNGLNINSPSLGMIDLSLVPVAVADQAVFRHGAGSSLLGSAAMGGALVLGTCPVAQKGVSVQAEYGSFDKIHLSAKALYGLAKTDFKTVFYRHQGQNDFSFLNTQRFGSPMERQKNAAYTRQGVLQEMYWTPSARHSVSVKAWFSHSEKQIQPAMTSPGNGEHQTDRNLRAVAEYRMSGVVHKSAFAAGYQRNYMMYFPLHSEIATNVYSFSVQSELYFSDKIDVSVGGQLIRNAAYTENYGEAKEEYRADVSILARYTGWKYFKPSLSLRQNVVSTFKPVLAPSLGGILSFFQKNASALSLKGQWGGGYRAPTLNERFWRPGGKPDILAETNLGGETGVEYSYQKGTSRLKSSITAYRSLIKNMILWMPSPSGGYWAPSNRQKVRTAGLEAYVETAFSFFGGKLKTTSSANYAFTLSTLLEDYGQENPGIGKQSLYVPKSKLAARQTLFYKGWESLFSLAFTGRREGFDIQMPAFTVCALQFGRTFNFAGKARIAALFRIDNLFGSSYQNYQYFAMPGRNYSVSVSFSSFK